MLIDIGSLIEKALSQNEPIEAIRQLAINLNKQGIKKEYIIKEFYVFDNALKIKNRDLDADFLEEVIDMITGYYVGNHLELD